MIAPIQKSIQANRLGEFLSKIRQNPGNEDLSIIIEINESDYSIGMLEQDCRMIAIEDVAYEEGEMLKLYCLTVYDNEIVPEVQFKGNNHELDVYDFFCLFHWPLSIERNVFIPSISINHNGVCKHYKVSGLKGCWDWLAIECSDRIITGLNVSRSVSPVYTCRFNLVVE